MLRAEGLGKRFGARWLFRRVDIDLKAGDRLLVTGPNGCGKSTLLRCLAGLERVTEGGITTGTLGWSALEGALYPNLSVAEHLEFAADLRGMGSRSAELLETVELAYAADVPAQHLSSGMKARLRLALALQPNPKVLLLDEPGASLDAPGRAIVERVCAAHSGCVVIATNDPDERRLGNLELELAA